MCLNISARTGYLAKKYQRQWQYTLEQTQLYVEHPKTPADGNVPAWRMSSRGNPDHFALSIDQKMVNALFQPSEQKYHAHGLKYNKANYACALVLEGERIRGIDYCEAAKTRFFNRATRLVPGWHENICYFDSNKNEIVNIHTSEGMETFDPADLDDFLTLTTRRWNIAISEQKEELL